jgi:hypothetical protein
LCLSRAITTPHQLSSRVTRRCVRSNGGGLLARPCSAEPFPGRRPCDTSVPHSFHNSVTRRSRRRHNGGRHSEQTLRRSLHAGWMKMGGC